MTLSFGFAPGAFADKPLEPVASYENLVAPLVDSFCLDCHQGDGAEGGLAFEKLEAGEEFQKHRAQWQEIARRLRAGAMPPPDYDAPTMEEREAWIAWIDARLDEFDCSGPVDPGWVTLRRLNRDQYRNTVRDLLGVKFEPSEHFPPDELGYGFDNNGDVLMLSPPLIEKYLAAAQQIASEAIVAPETLSKPSRRITKRHWQGGTKESEEVRALYSNGAIEFEFEFEQPGRYLMCATIAADQAGDEPVKVGLRDGDSIAKLVEVWDDKVWEQVFLEIDARKGKRKLGVEFLNDFYAEQGDESAPLDRNLRVRKLQMIGPIDDAMRGRPTGHRRWFAERPSVTDWRDSEAWRPLARRSIESLARHAFRRPPSAAEVDRLVELADAARRAGDSYERAMQLVVEGVLVSPKFLFIGNLEPEPRAEAHLVDEYELASRLSYFLWSSMPDGRLFELAGKGELRKNLRAEVDRMLRSDKSDELARNFTGQWLGTRLLTDTHPDQERFPEFDDALRHAMAREAELVVADLLRNNASLFSLIDARFTYLNERLARHYGVPGVEGDNFRRVELDNLPPEAGVRGGVLTMGGVLTTTSFPTRTAPVLRGKWILGELLGREPPPPPPDVPPLNERRSRRSAASLREQLEQHRSDPTCASCHVEMDSLGFALESYDAVGRWRMEDRGKPIDASGELPGGKRIEGVTGLQQALLEQSDQFRRCFTEKMLTYALARGLEYHDECAVAAITEYLQAHENRLQELIHAIVGSDPFQKRRGTIPPKEEKP